MPTLRRAMDPAAGLWIAWPKRASGVETDMTEDVAREVGLANRLVDNKVLLVGDQPGSVTLARIASNSSRLKARSVVVRELPSAATPSIAAAMLSSSGASITQTRSYGPWVQ